MVDLAICKKTRFFHKKSTTIKLKVTDVKKTSKKLMHLCFYDLTELQRDANRIYGYSAKETLSIMQTFMNIKGFNISSDSRYLTDDIVETIKERLEASRGGDYDNIIHKILKKRIKKQSHFVNNSKVSDHHAIIPTEEPAMLGSFTDGESKIYDLVLKRFLSVFLPAYEYEQTIMTGSIANEIFMTKGKTEKAMGWKEVYGKTLDEDER